MTLSEKETLIKPWPYPWPEIMEIARAERDDRLKNWDDPET